jgi:small subunit ribosomal protein S1
MSTEFERLLNENSLNLIEGSIIKVFVLDITNKMVIVDLNFKSEVQIDIEEFKNFNGDLLVEKNQEIEVLLEKIDDGAGNSLLSYSKGQERANKNIVEKSFREEDFYIDVIGKRMVNKGYVADYKGLEVFIPFSLLDVKKENNFDFLNNTSFPVKVIKFDFEKNSIFASRKYYLEKELGIDIEEEFSKVQIGDVLKGKVKTFMPYGVFVDFGFTDSLLHLNDMSWKKISDPKSLFQEGQEVEVVVTNIDKEKQRLSISLKEFNQKPWEDFNNEVSQKDTILVSIDKIKSNGIIVSYNEDIDFFIHYSDLSWYSLKNKIETVFSEGEEINVLVDYIDSQRKQANLKLKDLTENPVILFSKENKIGDLFTTTVVDSGSKFLKLKVSEGVYGYLFGEEISWNFDSQKLLSTFEKGTSIKVRFKSYDCDNHSLKFSLKDTMPNPFYFYEEMSKGETVNVVVVDSQKMFLIVETDNGARTLLKNESQTNYKIGQELRLKFKKSTHNSIELEF